MFTRKKISSFNFLISFSIFTSEPILRGIDRIRYIDETTDEEGGEPSTHERLLPLI